MATDGPTPMERFLNGILPENPVFRQLLGLCPTLAVTNNVKAALTMAGATCFVLLCANIMISLIRKVLKPHLRILVFTLTIATFVTIADKVIAAYMYDMSKQLGPFIPLIIVNCIIISRCEVCAAKQGVGTAIADGLGVSLGNLIALLSIASVREIIGAGTWLGMQVLPAGWPNWVVMILPPGAFLTLGLLMAGVNWFSFKSEKRA